MILKIVLVEAITDEEAIRLTIEALKDKNSAFYKGIKAFNQNEHVAGEVYINYLQKNGGRHPDIETWKSIYEQHSKYYEKPQFNLEPLETASPSTNNFTLPLNPNAKPFVPKTTDPSHPNKVDLIRVSLYANGKEKQFYIPEFKEGKLRLPEDMAKYKTDEDREKFGNQPIKGSEMKWTLLTSDKMQKDRVIQVDFHFTEGEDKNHHFYYNGIDESKFIPNTSIGWLILKLYTVAFRHLKMFELQKGSESEPYTLSCIDHSNTTRNFTPFFYQRTIETLDRKGITLDLLQEEANKEHNLL